MYAVQSRNFSLTGCPDKCFLQNIPSHYPMHCCHHIIIAAVTPAVVGIILITVFDVTVTVD